MQTSISPPDSWPYPVTIHSIHLNPGQRVTRGDVLLQFTFPDPEFPSDKRTSTFRSPYTGTIASLAIHPGQTVHRGSYADGLLSIQEDCTHPVQLGGLCAVCGLDLTSTDHLTDAPSATARANIHMDHSSTSLTVSKQEASRLSNLSTQALLQSRRLSLIVDLDQTVVHATVDPTIGEWMEECGLLPGMTANVKSKNPNGDALSNVKRFKLADEGRREDEDCWYYIKPRPGLEKFLHSLSKLYEMHVYTMGTRSYAEAVCRVIDPKGKIFGGRILSRDESGSLTAKSIERLFPVDNSMVVIIDDRSDVWEGSKRNLIKVIPYDFFIGIGDINSSFLPKLAPSLPPSSTSLPTPSPQSEETLLKEATEVQHQVLEDQLEDRPLKKLQDEIRFAEDHGTHPEKASSTDSKPGQTEDGKLTGDEVKEQEAGKDEVHQALLKNDDRELDRVDMVLREVHYRYYSAIDAKEKMKPDVKPILDYLKSRVLRGCVLVFSGIIPLGVKPELDPLWKLAIQYGAICEKELSSRVTHLIAKNPGTQKVFQAQAYPSTGRKKKIQIVNPYWLLDSLARWDHLPESPYSLTAPTVKLATAVGEDEESTTPPGTPRPKLEENEEEEEVVGEVEVVDFDRDAADRELQAFLESSDGEDEDEDEEGEGTSTPEKPRAKRPRPSTPLSHPPSPTPSSVGTPLSTEIPLDKQAEASSTSSSSTSSKRARFDKTEEPPVVVALSKQDGHDGLEEEDDGSEDEEDEDEDDEAWAKEFAGSILNAVGHGDERVGEDG